MGEVIGLNLCYPKLLFGVEEITGSSSSLVLAGFGDCVTEFEIMASFFGSGRIHKYKQRFL